MRVCGYQYIYIYIPTSTCTRNSNPLSKKGTQAGKMRGIHRTYIWIPDSTWARILFKEQPFGDPGPYIRYPRLLGPPL